MTTRQMPEALLSTPADATYCPACEACPWDQTGGYGTGALRALQASAY